jgi:general secretion pathway protein G
MEVIYMKKKTGFTLMELLIVIAIIGILISISVASYASAQKKGRDARRHADLKAVQNAWEQYYADNSASYPATCAISTTYMPNGIPVDPKSGTTSVVYPSTCSSSTYCFCAYLEGEANSKVPCAASTPPYTSIGVDCVQNLQ